MKKFVKTIFSLFILFIVIFFFILSTKGIETRKFNNFIATKISESNKHINLTFDTIIFKFDFAEVSLFLQTLEPKLKYHEVEIPTKSIKVYIDFTSLMKTSAKIKKININLEELEISRFKKLIANTKPSNLKNIVKNNIINGKILTNIEFYLNQDYELQDFIARGEVSEFKFKLFKDISFEKVKFNFFADKSDVLFKNIEGEIEKIKIKEGDLKINVFPELKIESNFLTFFDHNAGSIKKLSNLMKNFQILKDLKSIKSDLNNNLFVTFDKTYKLIDYKFESSGNIEKSNFEFHNPINNYFSDEIIKKLYVDNSKFEAKLSPKKKKYYNFR